LFPLPEAGSAKTVSIRVLLFGFACLFLSLAIACGAPQFQNAVLIHLPPVRAQNCPSHSTIVSTSPFPISSGLVFYSPTSHATGRASCLNEPHSFSPVFEIPANTWQQQSNSGKANGQPKRPSLEHAFWDRENDLLFAAVGASRTLDYFSTLNFRRRGRNEALLTNDIVDNHAAFASIEAAATLASIGASYLFHRYHHHRLERWTSIVHASLATSGAVRNYCLKTAHP
jgi:hypothetical protein